ncbi:MAG: hypothetical protein RMM28_10065 [Thermoleophilia bacterium]|nr:hypothetical protein [Gaiellaceae bacterium]MDW8339470.1 hypothetical protein [Thermoleophilia bacterium]
MSARDDDILDFDFFDEAEPPAWEEPAASASEAVRGGRGPRGRGPRFRAPGNLVPLLRLVGLVALAILVFVLLVVWIEGCTAERKATRFGDYLGEAGVIGANSARLGRNLATTLTTPGLKLEDLDAKLRGFAQTAESQVRRAQSLRPPGPLFEANAGLIEALQYRANGVKGLQVSFSQLTSETEPATAGEQLALSMQRLLASDVIWTDSFMARAQAALDREGVTGVEVPASQFVTAPEIATASALAAIWQRIQGASTGGTPTGLHGTGIAYVKALPSEQLLSTTTETTIRVTERLAFEVGVEDTGDAQEVQIVVTLTIPKQPEPIVRKETIPIIDPGEVKTVTFRIGTLVPFGERVSVRVDVDPVPGETNLANNSAEYPVIFTL